MFHGGIHIIKHEGDAMKVRLGYVAIALGLKGVTSSSAVTYTYYQKLQTEEKRLEKLKQVTRSNLEDLEKILDYNIEHEIHFYRLTSKLVPLDTHPDVHWNYREIFKPQFNYIGNRIKAEGMRVDTHPDQFNVINSVNPQVVKNTLRNLLAHVYLFEDLEYPQGKMVLHVGSSAGGKEEALIRFVNNFKTYPKDVTSRLLLENDDKTFTVRETLGLCQTLDVPMVLDVHHHLCNDGAEPLEPFLEEIIKTWDKEELPVKMHFSSPRDHPFDRKHADHIDGVTFVEFIEKCKAYNKDIDIMIEAKMKDQSLFNLVASIKELRPHWRWIDGSTFEL